jgi:hypothetical protein
MDPTAFDALVRSFGAVGSRRGLMVRLAALPLVSVLATRETVTAAERPLDRVQRRTSQRHRKQRNNRRNNKNTNKTQNSGPDTGGPQDCPNSTIDCYVKSDDGLCEQFMGSFGPQGHCGFGPCCPCDHPDLGYWNARCNQTFPACNGKCAAVDGGGLLSCWLGCSFCC